MLKAAKQFCAELKADDTPRWLSLVGTSGVGKTHLAKRITRFFSRYASYYIETKTGATLSRRGGFISFRRVANDLRSGDYSVVRDLCDDFFVCLDDIGSEHGTQFMTSKLDEIADARVGKWTVLTANLSLEKISEMETRIASRMLRGGSVVIDVDTIDFSLRKVRAKPFG